MQALGLHRPAQAAGDARNRSSADRRAPRPPRARATAVGVAAAAAAASSSSSSPSLPPPIVEWCPAGADASAEEEESDARGLAGIRAEAAGGRPNDAWRRPLDGWSRPQQQQRQQQDSAAPPPPHLPPVVALGKFDALHRGHRALARAAARECRGAPILLSFSGMAAVLGWPPRRPLVARQDRARVLDLWAAELAAEGLYGEEAADAARRELLLQRGGMPEGARRRRAVTDGGGGGNDDDRGGAAAGAGAGVGAAVAAADAAGSTPPAPTAAPPRPFPPVRQRYVPFASVRSLPPEAFVDLLSGQMRAAGAVAGANFRFGFKAAGDSAALERLCADRGMRCAVVGLLMRRPLAEGEQKGESSQDSGGEEGAVSSSRVREQLAAGRVEAAARSLGRPHRAVFVVGGGGGAEELGDAAAVARAASAASTAEFLPLAGAGALRNQPPTEAEYRALVSCFPLPRPATTPTTTGGGGGRRRPRDQGREEDPCLLELESQQRAWLAEGEASGRHPAPARVFFEETRVRVDAQGGVSAKAAVARRCLGLPAAGGAGGGGGGGEEGATTGFVLAVDFLGRSGSAWRLEVRTEVEDDGEE